jgi:hypothetical protein
MAQSRRAVLASKRYSKKTKEQVAREIRWEYYKANRNRLIDDVVQYSEIILQMLLAGVEVEIAFLPYVKNVNVVSPQILPAHNNNIKPREKSAT